MHSRSLCDADKWHLRCKREKDAFVKAFEARLKAAFKGNANKDTIMLKKLRKYCLTVLPNLEVSRQFIQPTYFTPDDRNSFYKNWPHKTQTFSCSGCHQ